MRKLLHLICFAIPLLLIVVECHAADGKTHLEKGLKAYREEADFDKAISELLQAIQLGLDNRSDLVQSHLYLGFAYIGKGQKMAAEAEFAKAIQLDPTLNLDPKLHSSKIVTVFNGTKDRLVGSLTIVSTPGGAEVFLDDQSLGVTPLRLNDILIGEHIVKVIKEYFQPKVIDVRVEKGKDNRVQVQLDKKEVELLITSVPSDAAVYFGEKVKGKTPLSLKMVLDQELTIQLAKEEFFDKELKVKLTESGFSVSGMEDLVPLEDGLGRIHVELDPAPPPGSLQVISDPPGAMVHLDGITLGQTPLTMAKATPGTRRLRVSMSGFASVTRDIQIISDRETSVEVALGGRLYISSIPSGAQVFIDEQYAGLTPLRTERIPAGSCRVRFAKERYRDKLEAAVVEKGQKKAVSTRLLPIKGSIAISSDPPGAAVYLDGESKGRTPLFIYGVMVGPHSLKLVKTGYEDWEEKITVEELKVSWQLGRLRAEG